MPGLHQPSFGFPGMPMGGGAGGGPMPFVNPPVMGGPRPPFMAPTVPAVPSRGSTLHHVPPGSGSVVLVSNLDPEVNNCLQISI